MVHGQKRVKFDREGNVILLEHALSQKLNIRTDEFHGEWNYTITPKK